MERVVAIFRRAGKNPLSRNAGWIMAGQGAGFLLQAGTFILLARLLGVREYGRFAGAFAASMILMPYSPLGTNMLFMRYVSADPSKAGIYWGNCITFISSTSVLLATCAYWGRTWIHLSSDAAMLVLLILANCLFQQIVLCASAVFQTKENLRVTAIMRLLPNLLRFLALSITLLLLRRATAFQWSIAVLSATGLSALISLVWVHRTIGGMHIDLRLMRERVLEGIGFSFAGSTQSAYNDIDKVILSRDGMNIQNGIYTLAYRIIDFGTTPIQSLDGAALPRYFVLNREGIGAVVKLAKKLVPTAALVGVGMAIAILATSPILPHLVGRDFSETLIALRWLCWIPFLRGIHQLSGSALTATGHQRFRTASQVLIAVLNLGFNLWLIPLHGWRAAAWTSLGSDGLLGLCNISVLWFISRRGEIMPTSPTPTPSEGIIA